MRTSNYSAHQHLVFEAAIRRAERARPRAVPAKRRPRVYPAAVEVGALLALLGVLAAFGVQAGWL